jgi:tetratricopeptide (TPR) repeat protein
MYAEALALNRAAGDIGGEAVQLGNLGAILAELGQLDESLDHLHQGLIGYRESGAKVGEAWALSTLGELHYLRGHRDVAREHLDQALVILRELGDRGMEAVALRALAVLRCDAGEYAEGLDLGGAALSLSRAVDHRRGEANALITLGEIQSRLGEHEQALAHYEEAERLSADTGGYVEAESITGLAAAQHRAGRPEQARGSVYRALGAARHAGYRLIEGCALTVVAGVDLADGKLDDALRSAHEAAALLEQIRYPLGLARALVVRGAVALRLDDRDTATAHWRRAVDLFTAVGAAEAEEVRELLAPHQ